MTLQGRRAALLMARWWMASLRASSQPTAAPTTWSQRRGTCRTRTCPFTPSSTTRMTSVSPPHTHTHTLTHTHRFRHFCAHTHKHISTHTRYIYRHAHIHTHRFRHLCTHTHTHTRTDSGTYVHTHKHISIHTHS